jgi:hypothetical protein
MNLQTDLATIKADLLSRLPLTEEQREELLTHARKVASNLLVKWKRHRWLDKEDLYSEATIHAEQAIREYDPTRSPDIKGWVGKRVSWRLRTWLKKEQRNHEYKPLIKREAKKTATELSCFLAPHDRRVTRKAPRDVRLSDDNGMTAGRWDRAGSYRDSPLRWLIAEEVAVAVYRTFDPRDVSIFVDYMDAHATEDIASKNHLTPRRVNQIVGEVSDYIQEKIGDTDVRAKQVVIKLAECITDGKKRAMRGLGFTEEEIQNNLDNSNNSISLFGVSG